MTLKLLRTRTRKALLAGASLVAVAFLWSFGRDCYWRSHPETAFRSITGRELPSGVRATAYSYKMTDNLFHTTHYWLLAGSPSALRQVVSGTDFVESEDARHMVPNLRRLFGSGTEVAQVVAGYEWELDRDRWYFLFAGETTACYVH